MRHLFLVFYLFLTLPVLSDASERVALVIGNASYKTAPLKNPVNDARAMAARLSELGFAVTRLAGSTSRSDMRSLDCQPSLPPLDFLQDCLASLLLLVVIWHYCHPLAPCYFHRSLRVLVCGTKREQMGFEKTDWGMNWEE